MQHDDKSEERDLGSVSYEHLIRSAPTSHLVPEREPTPPIQDVGEPPIPQTSAPTQHLVPPPPPEDPKD